MAQRTFIGVSTAILALAVAGSACAGEPVSTLGAPDCRVVNGHPHPGERATWSGGCRDGMADGTGVLEIFDDDKLAMHVVGRLRAGLPEGPLVIDSDVLHIHYEGALVADHFEGPGTLTQPDGVRLTARFVKGEPEGDVDAVMPDGVRYRGAWKDWRAEGRGEAVMADGARYVGGFHQGQREGHGKLTGSMGVMEGEFSAVSQEFRGVLVDSAGNRTEGRWVNWRFEGEMVLTTRAEVTRATYHDGLLDGSSDSRYWGGAHVVATYRAGLQDGPYRAEMPDGSVAHGQYRAGLKEGAWEIAAADGRVTRKEFLRGEDVTPPDPAPAPDRPASPRGGTSS